MPSEIFIARGNKKLGPFIEQQVREMLDTGMLSRSDLAWHEGLVDWISLQTLLGIKYPPPVPNLHSSTDKPTSYQVPEDLHRLKGIGGWLAFFCVGLTILGPLFSLGKMVSDWEEAKSVLEQYPLFNTICCHGTLCRHYNSSLWVHYRLSYLEREAKWKTSCTAVSLGATWCWPYDYIIHNLRHVIRHVF